MSGPQRLSRLDYRWQIVIAMTLGWAGGLIAWAAGWDSRVLFVIVGLILFVAALAYGRMTRNRR